MIVGFLGLERLGAGEIILIVAVLVLIFGARRIPEIARALGRSINEFKRGQQDSASPAAKEEEDQPEKKD